MHYKRGWFGQLDHGRVLLRYSLEARSKEQNGGLQTAMAGISTTKCLKPIQLPRRRYHPKTYETLLHATK